MPVIPMKILLPERRSFKREMEAIGWTNQQIETFLNKVARPAYVVPERLARSAGFFTRGALFRADHTRMVIMCERLGLIPQGMDVKDFARQLQHGKSVNYPPGLILAAVEAYCNLNGDKITGWNQQVMDFLAGKPGADLALIDSPANSRRYLRVAEYVVPGNTKASRRALLQAFDTYLENFGLHARTNGPEIELDLDKVGTWVQKGLETAPIDRALALSDAAVITAMRNSFGATATPAVAMQHARDVLALGNVVRLAEQGGVLSYRHGSSQTQTQTMRTSAFESSKGGVGEQLHLVHGLAPSAATYFATRGITPQAGWTTSIVPKPVLRGVFSAESNIKMVPPDFFVKLEAPVSSPGAAEQATVAVVQEEVTTGLTDLKNQDRMLVTMLEGMIGAYRTASIDTSPGGVHAGMTEAQARASVYRGFVRVLLGGTTSANAKALIQYLKGVAITSSDERLKVEPLVAGGVVSGVRGTARLDDGNPAAGIAASHVMFEITRLSDVAYTVTVRIGEFDPACLPASGVFEPPAYANARLVSTWYDSRQSGGMPFTIVPLLDRTGMPAQAGMVDYVANVFADQIVVALGTAGRITRADVEWIAAHDIEIFNDIIRSYYDVPFTRAGKGGKVVMVARRGELTARFELELASRMAPGMVLAPAMWGKDRLQDITEAFDAVKPASLVYGVLECPALTGKKARAAAVRGYVVLGQQAAIDALQRDMDARFAATLPRATALAAFVAGPAFFAEAAAIVTRENLKAGVPDDQYSRARHHDLVMEMLVDKIAEMQGLFYQSKAGAAGFGLGTPAVRALLALVDGLPDGFVFNPRIGEKYAKPTAAQAQCFEAWVRAWKAILLVHDVSAGWSNIDTGRYERIRISLARHFQYALVGAWPTGMTTGRGMNVLEAVFGLGRVPAALQLARLVSQGLWGLVVAGGAIAMPRVGAWAYARIIFAPLGSPRQRVAEYIVRFKPDADLDRDGFEVLATCTSTSLDELKDPARRQYAPAQPNPTSPSATPVTDLWAIIMGQQAVPPPTTPGAYTDLAGYLNWLPRIQVGGRQTPNVVLRDASGKPVLDANGNVQMIQDLHWVAMLAGIAPR